MPSPEHLAREAASRYPLPPVLYRLLNLNVPGVENAPEAGTVLAEVVGRDRDLVRRLRYMSGASGPWRGRTADRTLEQGVRDLGFRRVHVAALSITAIGGLPVTTTVVDFLRFWRYSVAVSFLTQSLGYYRQVEWLEFGSAAGLFHDIGRLLLEDADAVGMQRVRERQLAGEGPWLQLELDEFGFTAFEFTVSLLKAWDFPAPLVDTIAGLSEEDGPPLTLALRDAILAARAFDFATKTGRRYEVAPDVDYIVDRFFGGLERFTERVDAMLAAAMVAIAEYGSEPRDDP
ncbi:MAG: HDOD domain-containing protein [Dehalococcoidia bacterium]